MNLRNTLISIAISTSLPTAAEGYDQQRLLKVLGYSAGQAVACGLETPDKAARVIAGLAAAIGYADSDTRQLLDHTMASSRQSGCREYAGEDSEFRARWARQKRQMKIE